MTKLLSSEVLMKNKALPVFLVFLCMGFADAVGPFVSLAMDTFQLSNFTAQLIGFTGFIMFGVLSIPLGVVQGRTGKKRIMLLGLTVAFLAMIIPTAFGLNSFPVFLVIVLMLGSGGTMLQVSGNPIMRDISPEGKYSRNLSFSQFIKAIGSMSGPLLPAAAARYWGADWNVVFPVYGVCLAITIIFITGLKVEEKPVEAASFRSCFAMLGRLPVLLMVLSIFLYVGAEVCMSSEIPIYMKSEFNVDISKVGLLGTGIFFLALTIGRFLGAVILNWIRPGAFFFITALLSLLGVGTFFAGTETMAYTGIVLTGLGFANIFPLIFSITVDAMPERSNELSGLMVTAIVGGAVVPLLMGYIADSWSPLVSFIVPFAALIIIVLMVAGSGLAKSKPAV